MITNNTLYTQDEVEDMLIGKKGSAERARYDEDIELFLVGEALKKVRLKKNLTQEQLGKLIGVQKAQISKIENGKNLTLSTIVKVLRALGESAKIEIESFGDVSLC
jgi:HTH-type transcriptional regulator/antitoxin HipB